MKLSLRTTKPAAIKAFTGLTAGQIGVLAGRIWAAQPDRARGRPWMLSFPDRVFLVVLYWRTNLTFEQLAGLFDVSDSTVHRVVAGLTPVCTNLLWSPPDDRRQPWIVDGTLIPVRDRAITAKSKNYCRSVNIQVVTRHADGRICVTGGAWPGNRNDPIVYQATVQQVCVTHGYVIGDGAYRSCPGVQTPIWGPDNKIVWDDNYHRFRRKRARVEHVLERLKRYRTLRDHRRRG